MHLCRKVIINARSIYRYFSLLQAFFSHLSGIYTLNTILPVNCSKSAKNGVFSPATSFNKFQNTKIRLLFINHVGKIAKITLLR